MTRVIAKLRHYYCGLGLRGVFLLIWSKMSGTNPLCRVVVPGIRHPVTIRIGTTDLSVLRQVLSECQYDAKLPSAPRRIVDAGANIGLAAVFFANKYPQSEIVAVEPDESNFGLLTKNTKLYSNIYPVLGALWRQEGKLSLVDPGSGHHGFQTIEVGSSVVSGRRHVEAFTVNTLMTRMNWRLVDLLKMDIEGAEKEVFETSDAWMGSVGACMVELHDSIKPGCVAAFDRAMVDFAGRTVNGESVIAWRTSC
jgi:FkbM family methyltransferase